MKKHYLPHFLCSLAIVPAAHANYIVKANNTDALNFGSSWTGGAVPTSADIARFNNFLTGAAKSYSLGANTNWLGISFQKPSAAQTINGAFTLTLGASGIDASIAEQNFNIDCNVSLGGAQTWNVGSTGLIKVDGVISGTGSLTKTGSGQLFLRAPNTYTGDTFIKDGSLKFGLPSGSLNDRLPTTTVLTLGDGTTNTSAQVILNARSQKLAGLTTAGTSLANNVVNGSALACTLTLNNTSDHTFNGVLGGPGPNENNFAVIKSGPAEQTFSGANTYTGTTLVSAGTLLVNGSLGNTAVTVSSAATLGGSGTIGGTVTISSNGTLAPGNSADVLTINNNLNLGGVLAMEINGLTAGSLHDQVTLDGSAVLGGTLSLAWNLSTLAALNSEIILIDNNLTDGFTGAFTNAADLSLWNDNLGKSWELRYNGGTGNDLTLIAIPEPGAFALGLLGVVTLLRRRRS